MKFSKFTKARSIALALGAMAAISTASADATACGGAWFDYEQLLDFRDRGIDEAEAALEEGRLEAAAGYIIRVMPHVRQLDPTRSTAVRRAQRVLAVATARSDGQLAIDREVPSWVDGQAAWLGKDQASRGANLAWSIGALRQIDDVKKDDPISRTELAEALARVDEYRPEARDILEALAKKDLVSSAEGYAALADLRRADGDTAGSKLAMDRCKNMSGQAGIC